MSQAAFRGKAVRKQVAEQGLESLVPAKEPEPEAGPEPEAEPEAEAEAEAEPEPEPEPEDAARADLHRLVGEVTMSADMDHMVTLRLADGFVTPFFLVTDLEETTRAECAEFINR